MVTEDNLDKKQRITLLDKTLTLQLLMILLILIAYAIFLTFQRFLYSFEDFQGRIITVNILLSIGILVEIAHFSYKVYKKVKKEQ